MKGYVLVILIFLCSCNKCANKVGVAKDVQVGKAVLDLNSIQPNIVLVLLDDVGYEVPTYTGGQSYDTHNMDLIAAQGRQYKYCHSLPLCCPSRVELMTGKYNFRNYTGWGIMDTSNITIANVLKNAGYSTCVAGKWQFDGGDNSIHKFGFDKYSVWLPFNGDDENESSGGSHYKNPTYYENGTTINDSTGKYGEDVFREYGFNFMRTSTNPFFLYWAINLCHTPCTPTPDDPEYAAWVGGNNTKYFPSMVKYMDKELGMLKQLVDSIPNTIVIIIGDNGTYGKIASLWNGKEIIGGKSKIDEAGTRVPMIIYGNGFSGIDSSLICFADFFPTIATLAVASYGFTDGIDFINSERTYIFQHFQLKGNADPSYRLTRWVQNKVYKLYDTVISVPTSSYTGNFYRMFDTIGKHDKLIDPPTTIVEKRNDSIFKSVLSTMHN